MSTAVREAPHHNTLTCYTDYGCRLPDCKERYNARNRERIRAHKNGTWNALIDAEPVRRHLLALEAENVGPGAVAYTTGMPIQSILEFTRGRRDRRRGKRHRTTPEVAAKILAVTVDNHLRGRVPGIGTRRRIQALVAAGWPLRRIAGHAGLSYWNLGDLLRRDVVLAATAKAIDSAYAELCSQKPERHGVDRGQVKRARNWGKREKWATVGYWADRMDVIDDPDFEPLYGVTRRLIIAQDANELIRFSGLDKEGAAERLGVSKSYVEHAFRDHPEYAVEVAA